MPFKQDLLLTLCCLLSPLPALAKDSAKTGPAALAEWKGEFFGKKQGGLFLKIQLQGFKASRQTKFITGNVQITVVNLLKKQTFVLSYDLGELDGPPRQLWKAPSGKYLIKQIVMIDAAGVKRIWTSGTTARRELVVKRQCLSNLGRWTLSPAGASGLAVSFNMTPNSYKEEGSKKDSSVAAVLDGFNGLIQEKVGGKKVLDGAEDNYSTKRELRATVTFTRQIAMFYKLDLFKHNDRAAAIANVLSVYDPNLRRCYTDRLDYNDALRGDVKFTFLLSKQTGTMAKLKVTGGTANDPKLAECMYYELAQIQFPVSENMIGELTYTYDVK